VAKAGPHAARPGPALTRALAWSPRFLHVFFWLLEISSQLLGLGGRTRATAATAASEAFAGRWPVRVSAAVSARVILRAQLLIPHERHPRVPFKNGTVVAMLRC